MATAASPNETSRVGLHLHAGAKPNPAGAGCVAASVGRVEDMEEI